LGTVIIAVIDKRCPVCLRIAFYDGRDNGIFCISDRTAVTRELLDTRLYDICCVGNTFRDTLSSWKAKATRASAKIVPGGLLPTLKQRQGRKAFTCFLARLKFPTKAELEGLFSCPKCSVRDADGVPHLDAVVMDGTATGILGALPKFTRNTVTVSAPRSLPEQQYLLPPPKLRAFISEVLSSAYSRERVSSFRVSLRDFTGLVQVLLVLAFFGENLFDTEEVAGFVSNMPEATSETTRKRKADAQIVLSALRAPNFFSVRNLLRAMFVLDGNEPSFTRDCGLSSFTLIHRAADSELRRAAASRRTA